MPVHQSELAWLCSEISDIQKAETGFAEIQKGGKLKPKTPSSLISMMEFKFHSLRNAFEVRFCRGVERLEGMLGVYVGEYVGIFGVCGVYIEGIC